MSNYKYIDDDSFPMMTSDGPHASWGGYRLQQNAETVWDERGVRCGIRFHRPLRLCSPYRCAIGPFLLNLTNELYDRIDVHVYLTAVDWSESATDTPAGGSDAIYLAARCIGLDGRVDYPPEDLADWGDTCSVSLPLTTTATDQQITLQAPVRSREDTVGVMVWFQSVYNETAESSATVTTQLTPEDTYQVDTAPAYTTNPIERAAITNAPVEKGATNVTREFASVAIIGQYKSEPGKHAITLVPDQADMNASVFYGFAGTVDYHTMGVAEISGLSFEAVPLGYQGPSQSVFETADPAEEDAYTRLVATARHLVRSRVKTYSTAPGMHLDSNSEWVLWDIYDNALTGQWANLNNTYRCVYDQVIAQPPPADDRNGYRCVFAMTQIVMVGDMDGTIDFQLKLEQIADSTPTIYGTSTVTGQSIVSHHKFDLDHWEPMIQSAWWSADTERAANGVFQTRGYIIEPHVAGLEDHGAQGDTHMLQWYEVEIDEPETITYPCAARLYVRRDSGYSASSQNVLLAAAIFGRAL